MTNHIETLSDPTPKARRRVRRLLRLPAGSAIDPTLTAYAQEKAELRERRVKL